MLRAKAEKWKRQGDPGRQCKIKIDELGIDKSYQRPEVSKNNTLDMAKKWDWVSCGSIVVMQRTDGTIWVVDGQQRLLAAKHREDIKEMSCILFKSEGPEHEAQAFFGLNVHRRPVSSIAKFNAAVMARMKPQIDIKKWFDEEGFYVSDDGKKDKCIDFPRVFTDSWEENQDACKKAINAQYELFSNPGRMYSKIHKGLFYLFKSGTPVMEYKEKLITAGAFKVNREINEEKNRRGTEGYSLMCCGYGILNIINWKKRKRVIVPSKIKKLIDDEDYGPPEIMEM